MSRLVDLIAVVVVALVILMPRPSVDAHPALEGDPIDLDRIAALQDDLLSHPDDVATAVKLAQAYLPFQRADWALQVLGRFAGSDEPRVHLVMATAHAERLEARPVIADCDRFEAACRQRGCDDATLARAQLLRAAMQGLLDGNIDPAKDPAKAKEIVYKALHPGRFSFTVKAPAPGK